MLDKNKVKLGIAPIAWTNDDVPHLLGGETSFEQCVSEMALAGFEGCEVGSKYPRDVVVLRKALELRGLQICNAWFSSFLATKPYAEVEAEFTAHIDFLSAMGAKRVGVSEQSYSIQGQMDTPIFAAKPTFSDLEWDKLCKGLNKLAVVAASRGITLTFHHHMGTGVQTAAEIDRLMENTDADKVFLLFDSGHLHFSGECPVAVLKQHVKRVKHVHLKDIRADILARVEREEMSFLRSVVNGVFTVPGDGCIDFTPIFEVLSRNSYEGWMLVEAEQDPKKADPLEYAIQARKYIHEKTGL